jgi:oxalate decarboxylase/phosphoglucose isomerase-like protein (cupin superfamily)
MDVMVEPGVIERFEYKAGDGLMVPFGYPHGQINLGDEPVRAVFAFGPRLRPYDDATELSIDYREFEFVETH